MSGSSPCEDVKPRSVSPIFDEVKKPRFVSWRLYLLSLLAGSRFVLGRHCDQIAHRVADQAFRWPKLELVSGRSDLLPSVMCLASNLIERISEIVPQGHRHIKT